MWNSILDTFAELFSKCLLFVLSIIGTLLSWLGDFVIFIVRPVMQPFYEMLPNPSGMGFRYVFEAYKFFSVWVDFDCLYHVITCLVALHFVFMLYRFVLFIFNLVLKVKQMLPLVG